MPSAVDASRATELADALAAALRRVVRETAWALLHRADIIREGLDGQRGSALAELGAAPINTPLAQACKEYMQCVEALRIELQAANAVLERSLGYEPDDGALDPVAVSMAITAPVVPLLGEQLPINPLYPVDSMPMGWEQPLDILSLPALEQVMPTEPAPASGTSADTAIAVESDGEQNAAPLSAQSSSDKPIDLTSIDLDPLGGTDLSLFDFDGGSSQIDLSMFNFDKAT
ncbi:hypothetical protein MCUN1_001227 [Malassezia cuniculi]|uniref:Uncharacterized protein n=1 Tax=Malassezia cuniculi TaxID=948313 RepID=A0AAF0EXE2_9BASI|nr:hypothetical protein MCUN1_001227 [Malassezia cuniculi]